MKGVSVGLSGVDVPATKYALKSSADRQRFKAAVQALPDVTWQEKPEQYCDYRLDGKAGGGWLRAKQFTNGTLYLEASTDLLLDLMSGLLSQAPVTSKQTSLPGLGAGLSPRSPETKTRGLLDIAGAYVGTDESGKGDYFGPLVVAGVYVTDQTAAILKKLGVMDSKQLTDARIGAIHAELVQVVGEKAICTVEMGPAKYNELYAKFKAGGKNLNHLLAWGHATVIENLLVRFPECKQAIADQFGNERYIVSQLKEKGKGITLHQTHKAEANVGVAAASIVARYQFIKKIKSLSARFGVDLPLGANPRVKTQARILIEKHGRPALAEVAKLHFKTTDEL